MNESKPFFFLSPQSPNVLPKLKLRAMVDDSFQFLSLHKIYAHSAWNEICSSESLGVDPGSWKMSRP
jgi:hypothetical protein